MASQKAVKALIRDRMERKGISYNAARRPVNAELRKQEAKKEEDD